MMRPMFVFTVLAILFLAVLLIIAGQFGGSQLSDQVLAILNNAAGGLLVLIGVVVNFEFGSSKGSQAKDAMLSAMPKTDGDKSPTTQK